jgi:hypothetical protein
MRNARDNEGSYPPFSSINTVWRVTFNFFASAAWVKPDLVRSSYTVLDILYAIGTVYHTCLPVPTMAHTNNYLPAHATKSSYGTSPHNVFPVFVLIKNGKPPHLFSGSSASTRFIFSALCQTSNRAIGISRCCSRRLDNSCMRMQCSHSSPKYSSRYGFSITVV